MFSHKFKLCYLLLTAWAPCDFLRSLKKLGTFTLNTFFLSRFLSSPFVPMALLSRVFPLRVNSSVPSGCVFYIIRLQSCLILRHFPCTFRLRVTVREYKKNMERKMARPATEEMFTLRKKRKSTWPLVYVNYQNANSFCSCPYYVSNILNLENSPVAQ